MVVQCENCGEPVVLRREPARQMDREADRDVPAMHLVVGDGRILHRCDVDTPNAND
jgi:hypothetical protein